MNFPIAKYFSLIFLASALAGCQKAPEAPAPTAGTAEREHDGNTVALTKENLQHVTIRTEAAQIGNLSMTLKAAGRISANLNKTAKVTPPLEGRVTKLNFDLTDRVKTGDVLALVESPEILGKPLELKSPTDGVVIERTATQGELIARGQSVYTISDPAQLWVIAEVKERDIASVKAGQDATFTTLAFPSEKFHGRIALLGDQVEAGSRTLEARIVVDNADGRLKPGMFADVEILTTVLENVLSIPDSALQTDESDEIAFVALDENKFEKRVVKLGLEQSGRVQILEGIKPGEKVVTDGSFILKSEMLKGQLGEE